jgi:hypothetical protein
MDPTSSRHASLSPRHTALGRLVLTIALVVYGIPSLLRPEEGRLLDSVDLAIHETGHLVFAPFGEFVGFLGGTLFQLIVPAVFVGYFWRRGDRHAASVPLWWVAQNCWNISVYARDARAEELPLVGGGEHDWAYLLGRMGWLAHDQGIGKAIHAAGSLIYLLAIVLGLLAVMRGLALAEATDASRSGADDALVAKELSD